MIPYGKQDISQSDIDSVVDVLKSEFLTQGPVVPRFESAIADYAGVKYGVAVSSATAALHVACLALGVGPTDWLWTSPITFVATANCGLYCGASVDFVDIDPKTYNICPLALEAKLIDAEKKGCLPKIVIPVHLCGHSCDMQSIHALGQRFGFKIIEDASHAIGGKYNGDLIGNCQYSDITIFSFHPVKIITTAEGGIAVTNNTELSDKMALFRSHGITRDVSSMETNSDGPWYYEQICLGYNYRMTDMQAALGLSQLQRLDTFVASRHAIANHYDKLLCDLPLKLPWQHPDCSSARHLYVIRLDLNVISKTHLEVFDYLRVSGIGVNLHYIPIYRHPYYAKIGNWVGVYPNAEKYYAEAISIPIYPGLDNKKQGQIFDALTRVLT
jgi:UDP-4-amino-4,6-dideoxy-N-acetyl-beta-L-altrosamine transaminase